MYCFLLQSIFMLSIGAMIYILASAVPRVDGSFGARSWDLAARFIRRIPLTKIDSILSAISEKLLRRVRVVILKIDNWVSGFLGRIKSRSKDSNKDQLNLFDKDK